MAGSILSSRPAAVSSPEAGGAKCAPRIRITRPGAAGNSTVSLGPPTRSLPSDSAPDHRDARGRGPVRGPGRGAAAGGPRRRRLPARPAPPLLVPTRAFLSPAMPRLLPGAAGNRLSHALARLAYAPVGWRREPVARADAGVAAPPGGGRSATAREVSVPRPLTDRRRR